MRNQFRVWTATLYLALSLSLMIAFASKAAATDDAPTIAKDSIRVKANKNTVYSASGERQVWLPEIEFRVNGPIASGDQLYVQFSLPTKPKWLEFDCDTREIKKGEWLNVGYKQTDYEKFGVSYAGLAGFTIRLRNELLGTNLTLFTGKAQVVKVLSGPKYFEYHVSDDWTLPIGYVYFKDYTMHDSSSLKVGYWYRGSHGAEYSCHLFYQGKEIAKDENPGGGRDMSEFKYGMDECLFVGVYRTQKEADDGDDPKFSLEKNPGDYEVKVLIVNRLARSIRFSVDANGIVDNGIATANKLGSDRIIVPVQVIGNQGPWDKLAWKTGAFYGNPLTGFAALP